MTVRDADGARDSRATLVTMSAPAGGHRKYTLGEYVQLEAYSDVKHELVGDQIYAMGDGSPEHGAQAANVIRILGVQLDGRPCRVQTSDVRIRVAATGLVTYPDVSIVCGRAVLDAGDTLPVTNPVVLVEVLSPSTEAYDRGEKLRHYQGIPSLREVVFVSHVPRAIEVVRREPDGSWSRHEARAGERARLDSIDCDLPVDDVYRDPLG